MSREGVPRNGLFGHSVSLCRPLSHWHSVLFLALSSSTAHASSLHYANNEVWLPSLWRGLFAVLVSLLGQSTAIRSMRRTGPQQLAALACFCSNYHLEGPQTDAVRFGLGADMSVFAIGLKIL